MQLTSTGIEPLDMLMTFVNDFLHDVTDIKLHKTSVSYSFCRLKNDNFWYFMLFNIQSNCAYRFYLQHFDIVG